MTAYEGDGLSTPVTDAFEAVGTAGFSLKDLAQHDFSGTTADLYEAEFGAPDFLYARVSAIAGKTDTWATVSGGDYMGGLVEAFKKTS